MIATAFNGSGPLPTDANTEPVETSNPIFNDSSDIDISPRRRDTSSDQKIIRITIDGSGINWEASENISMPEIVGALDITKSQIINGMFPDTLQKLIQRI